MLVTDLFCTQTDPRDPRGRRHALRSILIIMVAALMAGANGFTAIGQWATHMTTATKRSLKITTIPCESTIRRVIQRLDPVLLDRLVGCWTWLHCTQTQGRVVISFDGKTIRGARTADQPAPHLLAGMTHHDKAVIAQASVDAKTNEIPALRDLLAQLAIQGCLIIADALHTQTATAQLILDQQAHFLLTVKGNTPSLLDACQAMPWTATKQRRLVDDSHGRHTVRSIRILVPGAGEIDFPGVTFVAHLIRTQTRHRGAKPSREDVYLIGSLPLNEATRENIATIIQNHWLIENALHHVRDVTFGEDARRVRTGAAPHVIAILTNLALFLLRRTGEENIAEARRACQWDQKHLVKTLTTSP
jgi:predicted transposase YbfD/YdcC